jgi:hypothetical protein
MTEDAMKSAAFQSRSSVSSSFPHAHGTSAGGHSAPSVVPKQVVRLRATEVSGSPTVKLFSGRESSHQQQLQQLSDDALSVSSDVSESLSQPANTATTTVGAGGATSHRMTKGGAEHPFSSSSLDRDREEEDRNQERQEREKQQEEEEDDGSLGNESAGEDSGDEETHLSMIAGLATSSLLSSNAFASAPDSALSSSSLPSALSLSLPLPLSLPQTADDLDSLSSRYPNLNPQLLQQLQQQQQPAVVSEWESSFVLATGSNNGQVCPLPSFS